MRCCTVMRNQARNKVLSLILGFLRREGMSFSTNICLQWVFFFFSFVCVFFFSSSPLSDQTGSHANHVDSTLTTSSDECSNRRSTVGTSLLVCVLLFFKCQTNTGLSHELLSHDSQVIITDPACPLVYHM